MRRPLKVLHIASALDRGGVETWLVNLIRYSDRAEVEQDLLTTGLEGRYEPELLALGARILRIPGPTERPLTFVRTFLAHMRAFGPYDVIVSHVHFGGGLILALARWAGIPQRIALGHTDTRALDKRAGVVRRLYIWAMQRLMASCTTRRLAVGQGAGLALFGHRPFELFALGIDLTPYQSPQVPQDLALPSGAPVVGHVGRFETVKNHAFLLKCFAAYVKAYAPDAQLLLVGEGTLQSAVRAQAEALGLSEQVHLLGSRPDVPGLLAAMSVFVFPSLFEGVPLALLEAQITGLPCVISEGLPEEAELPGGQVTRVALTDSPEHWAEAIHQAVQSGRHPADPGSRDIRSNVRDLLRLYRGERP